MPTAQPVRPPSPAVEPQSSDPAPERLASSVRSYRYSMFNRPLVAYPLTQIVIDINRIRSRPRLFAEVPILADMVSPVVRRIEPRPVNLIEDRAVNQHDAHAAKIDPLHTCQTDRRHPFTVAPR